MNGAILAAEEEKQQKKKTAIDVMSLGKVADQGVSNPQ